MAKTSIDKQRALPEDERDYRRHVVSIYQLFPNALLIWQLDHIEIWRAFPGRDDPSRCEVEMTIYKPAETTRPDSYWEKNRDIAIRTVMDEDFPLGERMQIGFESGATEEVIYGRNEPSLVHFHRSIRNALGVARVSQRSKPPFRADQVGSLLRSAPVKEARTQRLAGEITPAQLKAVEDAEIASSSPGRNRSACRR